MKLLLQNHEYQHIMSICIVNVVVDKLLQSRNAIDIISDILRESIENVIKSVYCAGPRKIYILTTLNHLPITRSCVTNQVTSDCFVQVVTGQPQIGVAKQDGGWCL